MQVLIPTIGQQATVYVDSHIREQEKKKKEYLKSKRLGKPVEKPSDFDLQLPHFTFNEQVRIIYLLRK